MNNNEIVQKLWNLANVLRDDGITYQQYVTELTYLLFLKMMKEKETEKSIPEGYRWDNLLQKEGIELKEFYQELLLKLGSSDIESNRLSSIYYGATTSIDEPKNLEKLIKSIDALDWYNAKEEGLGDLYEGLLEKNASETKSGAGQYFTPRVLIDVMVELMEPKPGEYINDPAAGTFGFMIAADSYLKENTDNYYDLSPDMAKFQRNKAFTGMELVKDTHRLALMNALLHDIEGHIDQGDSLSSNGKWMKDFDLVLTNPPFGTKRGGERATRDDITFDSSNKQLNFLQIIYNSLTTNGNGRAAVIVPDNVLFVDGIGEKVRKDLLEKTNLHTILRLPTGIFYAQGVQTNVLFFDRGETDTNNTQNVWIYDLRSGMPSFGKRNRLTRKHFEEFIKEYNKEERIETFNSETNPNGRWRNYTIDEIKDRENTSLEISWMSEETDEEEYTLQEMLEIMNEKSQTIEQSVERIQVLLKDVKE